MNPLDKELREAAERVLTHVDRWGNTSYMDIADLRLLAAHALRPATAQRSPADEWLRPVGPGLLPPGASPATALPPIHGNGAEDDTQALQARVNLAAAPAQQEARKVGCEDSHGLLTIHDEKEYCDVCRPACEPERATAQQPAAYLTRDGFPVGLEESVEEHAEPLYRGGAQQGAVVKESLTAQPAQQEAVAGQYQCDDYFCRPCKCTAPPAAPGVPDFMSILGDALREVHRTEKDAGLQIGYRAADGLLKRVRAKLAASPSAPKEGKG